MRRRFVETLAFRTIQFSCKETDDELVVPNEHEIAGSKELIHLQRLYERLERVVRLAVLASVRYRFDVRAPSTGTQCHGLGHLMHTQTLCFVIFLCLCICSILPVPRSLVI